MLLWRDEGADWLQYALLFFVVIKRNKQVDATKHLLPQLVEAFSGRLVSGNSIISAVN